MKNVFKNASLYAIVLTTLLFVACSSDSDESDIPTDVVVSQDDIIQVLESDELSGIADEIITDVFNNGATAKTRPDCYDTVFNNTGYTITFTDCVIDDENTVDGVIEVIYGAEQADTVTINTTFVDLNVNGIVVNGTRNFVINTNAGGMDSLSFTFDVTSNMTFVLVDGTEVSESGTKTVGFNLNQDLSSGSVTLDGQWTVNWGDDTYTANITDTLEADLECEHFGSGRMDLNKNGLGVTVDFGDGTCDSTATVIYPDGTEQEIDLNDQSV